MIISIPFSGFYESWHMAYMEDEVEQIAADTGLDEDKLWDLIDHQRWQAEVALEYSLYLQDQLGFRGEFKELWSPKFYNFQTDEIRVEASEFTLQAIKTKALQSDGFRDYVLEVCSDRPGFISYIPNRLRDWPTEWDERLYSIALEFLVLDEDEDMEDRISEDMGGNGGYSLPREIYEELEKENVRE